jgi:hypothetical protein
MVAASEEVVGSAPGPSSGAGSSREADPGGGSHTTSSSATGSQPPKPPEGGGDPGGGSGEVRKGVKPSQGSAKSSTKRKSARKEGTDAPSSAKKTGGAPNPVVDQQRPAEGPGGGDGDGVVQEEAGESMHDSDSDAMDKSSDSSSLSFDSDTDFLSDTYVIVDPEVKRNGRVVLESLLHPAAIMNIMAILDEEPAQQTVFFPAFSRYFVARGKSYENIIADLIRHREANQNGGAPLIVPTDVPKLIRIAHKRMGFLKATYRIFKDSATTIEQPNIDLIKTYMKACVRHYHALLPQLDLLAAQWGVDDDDDLGLDDFGSLRSEGVRTRRQTSLDEQLRIQVQEARKRQVGNLEKSRTPPQGASSSNSTKIFLQGKTSNSNPSEELQRMTRQAKDEVSKRCCDKATSSYISP